MIGVAMIKFQDNAQFMERYMDMEKKQQERYRLENENGLMCHVG